MPMKLPNSRNRFNMDIFHFPLPHCLSHHSNSLEVKKGQKELVVVSFSQAGKMERMSTGDILHPFRYRILACLCLWVLTCLHCCGYFRASFYGHVCHYAPAARVLMLGMDCIHLGASTEKEEIKSWSRTPNEWIRAAFLSSSSAEALQQDLWWEWHAERRIYCRPGAT